MPIKILPLFFVLALGWCQPAHAQLFPVGTKLHVAHLSSYIETWHQNYLTTDVQNIEGDDNKLYTLIHYPDWRHSSHALRIDSNKLFEKYYDTSLLVFDFNAQIGDSLSIYQNVFHSGNSPDFESIRIGAARIKIDTILYLYYFNENNQKDSLKSFNYSGQVTIPQSMYSEEETHSFRFSIVEKIITVFTTGSARAYLAVNVGLQTISDDHERLRCIEFPDGHMMKMEWWYNLTGNNLPCDYTFNVSTPEVRDKAPIELFPNPTSNQFIINNYSGTVSLYNQLGQHVAMQSVELNDPIDNQAMRSGRADGCL